MDPLITTTFLLSPHPTSCHHISIIHHTTVIIIDKSKQTTLPYLNTEGIQLRRIGPELLKLLKGQTMTHILVQGHVHNLRLLNRKINIHVLEQLVKFLKLDLVISINVILFEHFPYFFFWPHFITSGLELLGGSVSEDDVGDTDEELYPTDDRGPTVSL